MPLLIVGGMTTAEPDRTEAAPLAVDGDEARALALLASAHGAALSLAELADRGVSAPAHAIYMLQLAGYDVGRPGDGASVRLLGVDRPHEGATPGHAFRAVDRAFGIALSLALTALVLLEVMVS